LYELFRVRLLRVHIHIIPRVYVLIVLMKVERLHSARIEGLWGECRRSFFHQYDALKPLLELGAVIDGEVHHV
jgi:hypothetical protein